MSHSDNNKYGWKETTANAFPILLGIVIALAGFVWNTADQDFDKLEKSVDKMAESVSKQTESTIKLNTLMIDVIVPNTEALQRDMRDVRDELSTRKNILEQSTKNTKDLVEIKINTSQLLREHWSERQHNLYAVGIQNQIDELRKSIESIKKIRKEL